MATPLGGPYGDEYPGQPHDGGRPGRFNFPSAPSGGQQRPAPERRPAPEPPAHPRAPHPEARPTPPSGSAHSADAGARRRPEPTVSAPADDWSVPRAGNRRRPQEGEAPQPLVRPYAMTGGRTRPRYQLAIEALVSTTADPMRLQGQLPEHQRICQLCYEVKSVAEVSALLAIPLGVARILVADLAEAGLVAIHQPGHDGEPGGQPDVTLLERVLSGLRKL
ncbi:DUF742 domain-containing protein [Streptomyces sp. 3MP-14]|uniref:DUF742 domain-containing protein n=1 Tax=Streptomyces mimosae TaxID=2586635 RepID=A0A5N5ZJY7_9ACTN|nr:MULTISPECIES: DUF742 domain-containing protein [Streptomyces]KAB8156715.1 DUF742 domain-containing protein [Streptomyces mimosae]KAB8172200.1 DUF742 domain-containing protein [Streptomyces sp. 3MP-14]